MSVTLSSKAFLALFFISFFVRYFRLLINALALVRFKPHALPFAPSFTLKDVTFVMPTTFSRPAETLECLQRVHDCGPAKLVIVTSDDNVDSVQFACKLRGMSGVTVLGVPQLNKRRQMLKGLEHVGTEITFFIDDDVLYPSVDLPKHLLSCFEDPIVGAAGPRQRNRRTNKPNVWNFLGTSYLERRNFNTGATNYIDGGISTLSGRTQAIRTAILKNEEFYKYFCNDSFLGRKLMVDDDKALTRFIYSRGWNIKLNFHKDCTIETTFEEGAKYFSQCIRWARGHWRGNLIVMAKEDYWYRKHLWTLYAVYLSQFQTPAFLMDGSLLVLLQAATTDLEDTARVTVINLLVAWILFSKIVKLLPHLARHPQDCVFVPCGILFSYLHGFINVYALFTTHKTIWGSRATAEDDGQTELAIPSGLPLSAARPDLASLARQGGFRGGFGIKLWPPFMVQAAMNVQGLFGLLMRIPTPIAGKSKPESEELACSTVVILEKVRTSRRLSSDGFFHGQDLPSNLPEQESLLAEDDSAVCQSLGLRVI